MSLTDTLAGIVGAAHVITDPDVLDGRSVDHTGRYRGHAGALVRPGSADAVAAVLRVCREAGAYVTVQGGRTSLVAGTVPEHDDVLGAAPTGRWCTGTARFAATTPATTSRRCSSAPRARWASSPGWICGCIRPRRTGSPRYAGSTTSTPWSKQAERSGIWTASRRWS
jgi:hypothetical protein